MTEKTLRERLPIGSPRNKVEFLADSIDRLNLRLDEIELVVNSNASGLADLPGINERLLNLESLQPHPAYQFGQSPEVMISLGYVVINSGDTLEFYFKAKNEQEDPNAPDYEHYEYPFSGIACDPFTMNIHNHFQQTGLRYRHFIIVGFDALMDGVPVNPGDTVPTDGKIHHVQLTATTNNIGVSGFGLHCNFPMWEVKINTQKRNYHFPLNEGAGGFVTEQISGEQFEIWAPDRHKESNWVMV